MFRVVNDRQQGFSAVLGEKHRLDKATAEKLLERLLFPGEAARQLAFNLSAAQTPEMIGQPPQHRRTRLSTESRTLGGK